MQFYYKGGTYTEGYRIVKFNVFFIQDGIEFNLYSSLKNGLITKEISEPNLYTSKFNLVKIFMMQKGFGFPYLRKSFFLKLENKEEEICPFVKIASMAGLAGGFFYANAKLLTKKDGYGLIGNAQTLHYLEKESVLSLDDLKKLIIIDKTRVRKNIRHIRIDDMSHLKNN